RHGREPRDPRTDVGAHTHAVVGREAWRLLDGAAFTPRVAAPERRLLARARERDLAAARPRLPAAAHAAAHHALPLLLGDRLGRARDPRAEVPAVFAHSVRSDTGRMIALHNFAPEAATVPITVAGEPDDT